MFTLEQTIPGKTYKIIPAKENETYFHIEYMDLPIKDTIEKIKDIKIIENHKQSSVIDHVILNMYRKSIDYHDISSILIISKTELDPIIDVSNISIKYNTPIVHKYNFFKAFLYTKQKEAILCYLFSFYYNRYIYASIGPDRTIEQAIEKTKEAIENGKIQFNNGDFLSSFGRDRKYFYYLTNI